MRRVTPKVFLVAETFCDLQGMRDYLEHVGDGAADWLYGKHDALSGVIKNDRSQLLTEFMGKLCYRSWKPGLNANVSKVRDDPKEYIGHILKVGHGSVLEHGNASFVFADVSRVFTHELVRHRAGCAYSQESLRFVRLTDLGLWLPPEAEADPYMKALFEQQYEHLEDLQKKMAAHLGLDDEGRQFKEKKVLTSLMRRLAPEGLATAIGGTFNMRALRHVLTMRSEGQAEVEIRYVADQLGKICKERWPLLFQDFERLDDGTWRPGNVKV